MTGPTGVDLGGAGAAGELGGITGTAVVVVQIEVYVVGMYVGETQLE